MGSVLVYDHVPRHRPDTYADPGFGVSEAPRLVLTYCSLAREGQAMPSHGALQPPPAVPAPAADLSLAQLTPARLVDLARYGGQARRPGSGAILPLAALRRWWQQLFICRLPQSTTASSCLTF